MPNYSLVVNGLCIPTNNQYFVTSISTQLSSSQKDLTIEFLLESVIGFSKSKKDQKLFCLQYMTPWLDNLAGFVKVAQIGTETSNLVPSTDIAEKFQDTIQKVKSFLKLLIELTVRETEVCIHNTFILFYLISHI